MRNKIGTLINGKSFAFEMVTCDICGWGDVMNIVGVLENNKILDFCKRHKESEIVNFIEMDLPSYSTKNGNSISNKDLKNRQINIDYETKE